MIVIVLCAIGESLMMSVIDSELPGVSVGVFVEAIRKLTRSPADQNGSVAELNAPVGPGWNPRWEKYGTCSG